MEHRRTPGKRALTIPGSVMVATLTLSLIAAGVLIAAIVSGPVLKTGTTGSQSSAPAAKSSTPTSKDESKSPDSTDSKGTSPEKKPGDDESKDKSKDDKPKDKPKRDIALIVFNNTGQSGRAGQMADKARDEGWKVSGVGNWNGQVPETTIYYPSGHRDQADLLAKDMDIDRVKSAEESMDSDQITLVISGTP